MHRLYLTRLDRSVVLHLREGLPVLLSPDDPDGFIDAVRHYSSIVGRSAA